MLGSLLGLFGITFVVGGLWVSFTTLIANHFGSKTGGLVGGLPSTVLMTLLFVGVTQGPQTASKATTLIPLIVGFNCVFLVTYASLARKPLGIALGGGLVVWLALSSLALSTRNGSFGISLAIGLSISYMCYLVLEKVLKVRSLLGAGAQPTPLQLASRGALSGVIVGFATIMSRVGGPKVGGVFSVFPAVFLSTLISIRYSGGVEFSRAMTKPLLITASTNVTVYVIAVRLLYPLLGVAFGTAIAFLISLGTALFTQYFMMRSLS